MNVWIDLGHVAQYNFYKNFIKKLSDNGYFVYITVISRGKLPMIVKKELCDIPNIRIDVVGRHRMTKLSALFDVNIIRPIKMFFWSLGKHIDIGFSNGYICSFVCSIRRTPSFTFGDDPQTFDYYLKLMFADKSHYCLYEVPKEYKLSSKVKVLKALKEWAYLSPSVFKADVKALDEYNLRPKEYIFLREVSVGTVNYAGQSSGAIYDVIKFLPKDKKVLFSLEDKSKRDLYPSDWILLQEPIKDIHSLIYYSAALASSGDSMAREAALLGVPAYYLGIRHSMPANLAASKVADFSNEKTLPFEDWVKRINLPKEVLMQNQNKLRMSLKNEFVDVNEFMYQLTKANF